MTSACFRCVLFLCAAVFLMQARVVSSEDSPSKDSPSARPGHEWKTLAEDGAWCWFSDPRAVYYEGKRKRTYAGWADSEGSIVIGAYDPASGEIETRVLHEKLQADDHINPSILIRPDGRLMVFYSTHGDKEGMRLRTSEKPEDVREWAPPRTLNLNANDAYPKDLTRTHCYTNPYRLAAEGGRIYVFWRGIAWKPCVSTSRDGGETWERGRILILPEETYKNQRPYMKCDSNGNDRIHFAFTDGHPRDEPTNGIYYACYRDGVFYRADGGKIADLDAIPFGTRQADVVYDAKKTNVRAWVWDVAEDEGGRPAIVYTRLPEETDHRYHYARWDGKEWRDQEIAAAGKWFPRTPEGEKEREPHYSAGIVLDHEDPSVVYLSRPVNGVFEIEKWTTRDLGATWESRAITRGSKNHNVRPFAVRNAGAGAGPRVLWMHVERYTHYTQYKTSIKMDVP